MNSRAVAINRTLVGGVVGVLVVGVAAACGSPVSSRSAAPRETANSVTASASAAGFPPPCSFLTQQIAAAASGDPAVTNQAVNVTETESGYVACIYADTENESNSVAVQIKTQAGAVGASSLDQAATFFSRGEPVQPFQSFPVVGIGDRAVGETTPGVAFIVFSTGDLLVYVGADSVVVSPTSLRSSVVDLAERVASAL